MPYTISQRTKGRDESRPGDWRPIMSTISSYDEALDFYPEAKAATTRRFGGVIASVRTFWEAMAEGHAAAGRYHDLTARGMTHNEAASRVFSEYFAH